MSQMSTDLATFSERQSSDKVSSSSLKEKYRTWVIWNCNTSRPDSQLETTRERQKCEVERHKLKYHDILKPQSPSLQAAC